DRHRGSQPAVRVDSDFEIVADGFADRLQLADAVADHRGWLHEIVCARGERRRLRRGVALLLRLEKLFGRRADIEIHAHAISRCAAQQLIYRYAERLPENVPERDFDRADCRVENRPTAPAWDAKHRLPKEFDIAGILTDEKALVL